MALTQGSFQEYDFNRMVVLFTMKNDEANVACAISTDAMDQLEGSSRTPPAQREQQFLRLRDRIEARGAEIQRCRTGGQPAGRDPARDRFSRAAEMIGRSPPFAAGPAADGRFCRERFTRSADPARPATNRRSASADL